MLLMSSILFTTRNRRSCIRYSASKSCTKLLYISRRSKRLLLSHDSSLIGVSEQEPSLRVGLASLGSIFTEVKIFLGEAQINASLELALSSLTSPPRSRLGSSPIYLVVYI